MAKSVFLPLNQCSICVSWFFLGRRQMWASGGGSCYPEKPIILYVGNWNSPLNSLPFQSLPSRSVTILTSFLSSLLKSSVGLHCYQVQVQTHKLGGSQEALCTRFQVTSAASPFCHIPCPRPPLHHSACSFIALPDDITHFIIVVTLLLPFLYSECPFYPPLRSNSSVISCRKPSLMPPSFVAS